MTKQFIFFDYHTPINETDSIISYKGSVTADILSEIAKEINITFSNNRIIRRKLVAIFIELAQNISFYSVEFNQFGTSKERVGTIILFEDEQKYTLIAGNLVQTQEIEELQSQFKIVNSLTHQELRKYKREQRDLPTNHNSKGAGIGFIQVALISNNPLEIVTRKLSEGLSFFSLSVTLNKIKNTSIKQTELDPK